MSEIRDKYQEPLEGDPSAFSEKVELKKEDFSKKPSLPDESVSKEQEVLELEKKLAEKKMELNKEVVSKKNEESEPEKETTPRPNIPPGKVQQRVKQLKDTSKENQVKALCDLAFQKGLDFAVETAKNLDNAYVLDEFHDTLVDELREKLIQKGELKKL
ncbi:MAG: hypothetical protein CMI55_03160 [Parcubacteria group bacterium]|nr:hypothetical protein [Parcubacteria group bacterium]|tara:strand:+ start:630 stop:1106 length:477 start_codon:yes stop_codon:yes gene_type:complete